MMTRRICCRSPGWNMQAAIFCPCRSRSIGWSLWATASPAARVPSEPSRRRTGWEPFSLQNHYGRLTADALGAEYRCISQSGWGLVTGWDNDVRHVMPPYYTQVCGVAMGQRNAALGAQQENDFAAWKPDAVIVNLGTNDTGAFDNPPWQDPATGKPHQMRRLSNGGFHPADAQKVANGVQHFLTMLRAKNPGAKLVWCIGMLGSELLPVLRQGMEQYKTITGDSSVYLLELPNTTPETVGARQHPGAENHRQAAKVLTAFLRTIL